MKNKYIAIAISVVYRTRISYHTRMVCFSVPYTRMVVLYAYMFDTYGMKYAYGTQQLHLKQCFLV